MKNYTKILFVAGLVACSTQASPAIASVGGTKDTSAPAKDANPVAVENKMIGTFKFFDVLPRKAVDKDRCADLSKLTPQFSHTNETGVYKDQYGATYDLKSFTKEFSDDIYASAYLYGYSHDYNGKHVKEQFAIADHYLEDGPQAEGIFTTNFCKGRYKWTPVENSTRNLWPEPGFEK